MITSKLGQSNLSGNLATTGVRNKNLNDYLENKTQQEESTADAFTLTNRPTEGMFNMEPIERYKYILNQSQANSPIKLSDVQGNPEKSLKQANEILNKAVLPPTADNPDSAQLAMAMLVKRMAGSRLDLAA